MILGKSSIWIGRCVVVALCLVVATIVQAQSSHVVKSGETLFSISRQYGVAINLLEQANGIPEGTAAIKIGQTLTIPLLQKTANGVAGSNCREMYRVKKKDTLYGIAQKFDITVALLQDANPETKVEGYALKKGVFLCIPFKPIPQTPAAPQRVVGLNAIRVGVLLPFKGKANEAKQAKEFYQGLLLAVDSMQKLGLSAEIIAMDLSSVAAMDKIEQSTLLKDAHLLFAPFDAGHVSLVADYAKRHKIATVVPYTSRLAAVGNNPYLYLLNAPSERKDDYAISTILAYFATQRFVFIETQGANEQEFVAKLKAQLVKNKRGYTEIHQGTDNAQIKAELEKHVNAIVLPNGSDEATLRTFVTRMRAIKQTYGTPFTILGYPQWQLYASTYAATFNDLDTYIYTPFYSSPHDVSTKKYNQRFVNAYGQTPTTTIPNSSMMGFDAGMYFMLALQKYGTTFAHKTVSYEGVQSRFSFQPYSTNGSYINSHMRLVHYY